MSYGLRVWDASGNLTLDISDRLTRFVGTYSVSFTVNGPEADKLISVSGMVNDGTWFASGDRQASATVEAGQIRVKKTYAYSTLTATILVFRI